MMTVILVFAIFLIISILIWVFFGSRDEELIRKEEVLAQSQEKVLRRRSADKEIENEGTAVEQRRESDKIASDQPVSDDKINLPYQTNEIIPETSRFRIYRRTLLNSEIYIKKGHYTTAISLYGGVAARINDATTKQKIEENIEYLKKFIKNKKEQKSGSSGTDDLKVSMDGSSQKTINIEVMDKENSANIDRIVSKVARQLKNEIEEFKQLSDYDYKEDAYEFQSEIKDINKTLKNLNNEISEAEKKLDKIRPKSKENIINEDSENLNRELEENEKTIDDNVSTADIDELKDEVDTIKDFIDSIEEKGKDGGHQEKHTDDRVLVETDKHDKEVSDLKNQVEHLEDKLEDVVNKLNDDKTPIILDPTPILDLMNRIPQDTVGKAEPGPEKYAPEETEKKGHHKRSDDVPDSVTGSVEEKTRKIKDEEDIDPNEFELLSEYGKDPLEDEDLLTDQEIFEKILKDDKKKKSEEEGSFEIIGDKKGEQGEYDILSKEEERKKREEESFYKNFVKTNKKKKRELPILKVSYDFSKLPEPDSLSKEKNILEYSFYKYRPMLAKAGILLKKRRVREAIDYYRVVLNQNIPPEFKMMIKKNINDLTEYLEKYLTAD